MKAFIVFLLLLLGSLPFAGIPQEEENLFTSHQEKVLEMLSSEILLRHHKIIETTSLLRGLPWIGLYIVAIPEVPLVYDPSLHINMSLLQKVELTRSLMDLIPVYDFQEDINKDGILRQENVLQTLSSQIIDQQQQLNAMTNFIRGIPLIGKYIVSEPEDPLVYDADQHRDTTSLQQKIELVRSFEKLVGDYDIQLSSLPFPERLFQPTVREESPSVAAKDAEDSGLLSSLPGFVSHALAAVADKSQKALGQTSRILHNIEEKVSSFFTVSPSLTESEEFARLDPRTDGRGRYYVYDIDDYWTSIEEVNDVHFTESQSSTSWLGSLLERAFV